MGLFNFSTLAHIGLSERVTDLKDPPNLIVRTIIHNCVTSAGHFRRFTMIHDALHPSIEFDGLNSPFGPLKAVKNGSIIGILCDA
jgi:hypothetical protein